METGDGDKTTRQRYKRMRKLRQIKKEKRNKIDIPSVQPHALPSSHVQVP
jgi:hypothetical protein